MKFSKILSFISVSLLFFVSCSSSKQNDEVEFEEFYTCNAEKIDPQKNKFSEVSDQNIWFQNSENQSDDVSYSGAYSVKLFPGKPYGFTTEISDVHPDDYIQLTAWRRSKNEAGVISLDGGKGFYTAGKSIIEEDKNGWQKIFVEYFVPPNFYADNLKVYVWNNSSDTIYFDDLTILHRRNKKYPDFSDLKGLQLHIDDKDISMLGQKRLTAFETTVLMNSDDDYSSMVLFDGNDFYNGSLRLKGDLIDHLNGQKWSFRIKLKKDFAWKYMRTFSIQNPSTRYFLNEWLAHKIFDQEDILSTRYGFIPVQINLNPLGIYAWEEHFEKQLVESRNRREGPIIRFNENVFWQLVLETNVTKRNWDIDYFAASKIIPFKEGQITSDSLKTMQFEEAQNLLLQYKNRSKKVSKIFDVQKLAAYYALLDVTQAYHGFAWHNQRFYYNPVTCLLEPIAFDGYIETGIYKRIDEPVTGLLDPQKIAGFKKEELMLFQAFSDSVFNKNYVEYLEEYSSEKFVESLISKYKNETDSLSGIINREFPYYHFGFGFIKDQTDYIRNNIERIRNNIKKIGEAVESVNNENFRKEYTTDINPNLVPFQIHAFYNREKNELDVLNFTNSTVKVLGVFIKDKLPVSYESENVLPPFNGFNESKITLNVNEEPGKLLFSIDSKMYETEVSNWQPPHETSERQKMMETRTLVDLPIDENKIIFKGNLCFTNDVVIPQNMEVVFKPGTKIDLVENAGFFSFSPLKMEGTETNPIEITSSDNSASGFNILQAKGRSSLKYVHFSELNSLRKAGWQTPAAITFYESNVNMEGCSFANNFNCDDALNVVRSNFNVVNCRFENTFADAFDSDFSNGLVSNCTFQHIGNDAIDFSGSQVEITDCKMFEINDKAISGGEQSKLNVTNCEIQNANIGVASKDLSEVILNKISIKKVVYGLVAFQKKPEYGSAKIIIENLMMKNYIVFHQIERGSTLVLNGKTFEGKEKNIALKLYQ